MQLEDGQETPSICMGRATLQFVLPSEAGRAAYSLGFGKAAIHVPQNH